MWPTRRARARFGADPADSVLDRDCKAHEPPDYPDLAFPQHLSPEVSPPGWRPVYVDYLYLGFTNGMAFSPTDVMPLAHWAKVAMGVQSGAALVIIGLVVARAVNILG